MYARMQFVETWFRLFTLIDYYVFACKNVIYSKKNDIKISNYTRQKANINITDVAIVDHMKISETFDTWKISFVFWYFHNFEPNILKNTF